MKSLMKSAFTMTLLGGILALGCSSSGNGDDAGTEDAAVDSSAPFGLTPGDNCFDVVSIKPGSNDACEIGVADTAANGGPVGAALLVNYNQNTAILTVGTNGVLGGGQITFNMGTLMHDALATDAQTATCTWQQTDTSVVTLTATNEFDIAVTEVEKTFASACTNKPPTDPCTSTWTWHMKIGNEVAPACN